MPLRLIVHTALSIPIYYDLTSPLQPARCNRLRLRERRPRSTTDAMTGAVLPRPICICIAPAAARYQEPRHPIAQRELLSYVHNDVIAAPGLDHGPPRLQAFPTKGRKGARAVDISGRGEACELQMRVLRMPVSCRVSARSNSL